MWAGRNSRRQISALCSTFKRSALIQCVSVICGSEKAGNHWINQSIKLEWFRQLLQASSSLFITATMSLIACFYLLKVDRSYIVFFWSGIYWKILYYVPTRTILWGKLNVFCHLRTKTMIVKIRWYHGNMFIGFFPLPGYIHP